MHFECIRNVSDHFVNQKEIAMWSERVVIVHQIITHFCRRDNLLLHGDSRFTVIFNELANTFDFLLYSKKIDRGTCIINFFKTLLIGIDFPKLIISALSLLRLNAVIGNYWRAIISNYTAAVQNNSKYGKRCQQFMLKIRRYKNDKYNSQENFTKVCRELCTHARNILTPYPQFPCATPPSMCDPSTHLQRSNVLMNRWRQLNIKTKFFLIQ